MGEEYGYSTNGEYYTGGFASREEAAREGAEMAESRDGSRALFWTGRLVPYVPQVDGDAVLEEVAERAWEEMGECTGTWPRPVQPEHRAILSERLTAVFQAWTEEFGYEPDFRAVTDVQTHPPEVLA